MIAKATTRPYIVKASINAKDNKRVPLILPSASGWRASPSIALPDAVPCPIPGPIAPNPIAKPAPITEAAQIIGFLDKLLTLKTFLETEQASFLAFGSCKYYF